MTEKEAFNITVEIGPNTIQPNWQLCDTRQYPIQFGVQNFSSPEWNNTTCYNNTLNDTDAGSFTKPIEGLTIFSVFMYGVICSIGLLGNGLVILVILRYTKMKTVTNLFILNLSIADSFFLVGLPLVITTTLSRSWIFGDIMCKIYTLLTCINWFTGAFTLAVMSGDRFLAVCYPLTSMKFRTPKYAIVALVLIWSLSLAFMIPVAIFSSGINGSCIIKWPEPPGLENWGSKIFTIYTLLFGFLLPLFVIVVLYTLLILRLHKAAPSLGTSGKRKSHATKVTKLVTIIISVFIFCWLPYWCFQVFLSFCATHPLPKWQVYIMHGTTLLSYANSMINPILYAFTNENFREAFLSAFKCAADPVLGYPRTKRRNSEYVSLVVGRLRSLGSKSKKQEDFEFTMVTNCNPPLIQQNGDTHRNGSVSEMKADLESHT